MHVYVYMYEIYVYEMAKAAYLLRSVTLRTREVELNLIKICYGKWVYDTIFSFEGLLINFVMLNTLQLQTKA